MSRARFGMIWFRSVTHFTFKFQAWTTKIRKSIIMELRLQSWSRSAHFFKSDPLERVSGSSSAGIRPKTENKNVDLVSKQSDSKMMLAGFLKVVCGILFLLSCLLDLGAASGFVVHYATICLNCCPGMLVTSIGCAQLRPKGRGKGGFAGVRASGRQAMLGPPAHRDHCPHQHTLGRRRSVECKT